MVFSATFESEYQSCVFENISNLFFDRITEAVAVPNTDVLKVMASVMEGVIRKDGSVDPSIIGFNNAIVQVAGNEVCVTSFGA